MTVKTRITLLITGAGLISSLVFSAVVFLELIEQPFDLIDKMLEEEARGAAVMMANGDKSELDLLYSPHGAFGMHWIEVYDEASKSIVFKSKLADEVRMPKLNAGSSAIVRSPVPQNGGEASSCLTDSKKAFRVKAFSADVNGRKFTVQIARIMEKLHEEITDLVFGIVMGLIFSTAALILLSRFMACKILKPVGEMKNLARAISEKNLDERIPQGDGKDEFSELAATINSMLDRLRFSFARQRNFLFDTSHELKTPLSTMRLAMDEIFSSGGENLPHDIRDNVARLNNQVLRMERLVKDLLNLSSLETLSGIEPELVKMADILSSLVEEYKIQADARCITINVSLSGSLTVNGDREKLYRAFSNILDNAVKYNVDGGSIWLSGIESASYIEIVAVNTGAGVAKEDIPKVFDQFYRAEKSRSSKYGGSGLGLAIVKRIIDLHSGEIRFESEQGGLTRVTVHLPRWHKID